MKSFFSWIIGSKNISMAVLSFLLKKEEQFIELQKKCALSTGNLPLGSRKIEARMIDRDFVSI